MHQTAKCDDADSNPSYGTISLHPIWCQDEDILSEGDGIASRGSKQYKGQAKYTSCKESRALDKVIELLTFSKGSLGELTVGSYVIQFTSIPRYGYFAAAVNRISWDS